MIDASYVTGTACCSGKERLQLPFYLVDEADKCSGGKLVVIVRDPEHRLLGPFVTHLLGQDATFFGSLMPVVWVVEMRDTGLRPS